MSRDCQRGAERVSYEVSIEGGASPFHSRIAHELDQGFLRLADGAGIFVDCRSLEPHAP